MYTKKRTPNKAISFSLRLKFFLLRGFNDRPCHFNNYELLIRHENFSVSAKTKSKFNQNEHWEKLRDYVHRITN